MPRPPSHPARGPSPRRRRAARRSCRRAAGTGRRRTRRAPSAPRALRPRESAARSPGDRCRRSRRAATRPSSGTTRSNQTSKNGRSSPRGCVISRIARRPPGRSTRRSSARPRSSPSTLRTPKPTVTASNEPSANGRSSMSPCTHSTDVDLRRARSSMRAEKSRPVTTPPSRSAASARSPVPQHASSTRPRAARRPGPPADAMSGRAPPS